MSDIERFNIKWVKDGLEYHKDEEGILVRYDNHEKLLSAAQGEIEGLKEKLVDCQMISSATVGHQGSIMEALQAQLSTCEAEIYKYREALERIARDCSWKDADEISREALE